MSKKITAINVFFSISSEIKIPCSIYLEKNINFNQNVSKKDSEFESNINKYFEKTYNIYFSDWLEDTKKYILDMLKKQEEILSFLLDESKNDNKIYYIVMIIRKKELDILSEIFKREKNNDENDHKFYIGILNLKQLDKN